MKPSALVKKVGTGVLVTVVTMAIINNTPALRKIVRGEH